MSFGGALERLWRKISCQGLTQTGLNQWKKKTCINVKLIDFVMYLALLSSDVLSSFFFTVGN